MSVKAIRYILKGDIIKISNIPENKIGRKGLKLLLSNKHQISINLSTTMYIDTLIKEGQQVKKSGFGDGQQLTLPTSVQTYYLIIERG